ncbi:YfgM family protein [Paracidovorax wautersii]|uniref:Ancillary SecYEG translocon subunit n=1 Tax=Paracidovorax wautersii TaxID=1177982 RepID=A0A1I2HN90_9BURK|nr:tetratricopeptide repeat protein [Paracidovorax wautersii]SFF30297.1 Putative negative regulator of RcsB-dependent stress response [Paracidovorax wautersii]
MANHFDLEEQEQLDQIKHFWNTWGTLISSVLIVVFGAIAAWNGYQYWQNRQASQAAALADAMDSAVASADTARIEQVFADMKSRYGGTVQAGQAGLLSAKALFDAGKLDAAKAELTWLAQNASDDGYKALARLRLAGVLIDEKAYDEAMKQLSGSVPAGFDAAFADRKGDVLALQGKKAEAIAEYERAYKAFEDRVDYRRLVEVKLNALGASVPQQSVAVATSSGGVQ